MNAAGILELINQQARSTVVSTTSYPVSAPVAATTSAFENSPVMSSSVSNPIVAATAAPSASVVENSPVASTSAPVSVPLYTAPVVASTVAPVASYPIVGTSASFVYVPSASAALPMATGSSSNASVVATPVSPNASTYTGGASSVSGSFAVVGAAAMAAIYML